MAGALIRWMNICKFWNRSNITRWLKSHFDFPLFMQSCASIFSKVLWRNKHRETSNMNLLCIRNTLSYFRSHDIQCRPLKPRLDMQPFVSHSRPEIVARKQGLTLQQLFPYKSQFPPIVPSTTHIHGHFVLSPVSLASRDQDGGPSNSTIDIYDLTEK